MESVVFLVLSLGVILLSAEFFTNGVEVIGRRMAFSQAVVGSILAAVGTALPETILPIVAIISHGEASKEIGVGAILGAPFMLATLGFFLVGGTAYVLFRRGVRACQIHIEEKSLRRDLMFFIVMYAAAVLGPLVFGRAAAVPLAVLLVLGYCWYVQRTIAGESAEIEHFEGLHILKLPAKFGWADNGRPRAFWALVQIVLALGVMVSGAHLFVKYLGILASSWGMDPLLFALLVAPVATELPEKFNSVTWTLKGKDALAVGNITGAMVFQSTFPVSVGLLFTPWEVRGLALGSAILALVSAALVLGFLLLRKRLNPLVMMAGGLFYVIYVFMVLKGVQA